MEGLSNNRIAHRLYLEPSTVKSHVLAVLRKLGVASRLEAATFGFRAGLDVGP